MGRRLVPLTMIAATIALAVAALTTGLIVDRPAYWQAVVPLAMLGGIAPMIYAVNIRVVPVFSRRQWRNERLVQAQVGLMIAGAWLVYAGRMGGNDVLITAGSLAALASGICFMANIAGLFRQPASGVAPPLPHPNQKQVDGIAIVFNRISSIFLLIGLTIGVVMRFWEPDRGRWDLVWAHTMLVGFMLSMASGICYHVLSRWTGRPWGSLWPIRLHLLGTLVSLPLMLVALAFDAELLFHAAGPLLAASVALFAITVVPFLRHLGGAVGIAMLAAVICLVIGIGLGGWFAIDPAIGARLRLTHAGVNLFGFTGLLISGVSYYLAPRFAGHPIRWPRLAWIQIALLLGGVAIGSAALAFRAYGHVSDPTILAAHGMIAAAFLSLGALIAGAFFGHPARSATTTTTAIQLQPSRGRQRQPISG